MPNLQCRKCGQVETTLDTPADRGIDGYPLCDPCVAKLYGDRKEPQGVKVKLFEPAPNQIAGQLSF